jgi:aldose 1-epimerase
VLKTLEHAGWEIGVLPEAGASIPFCRYHDVDVLRPVEVSDNITAGQAGCFPLVPFSNRVREGRFSFEGKTVRLPIGGTDPNHAIHGVGWRAGWQIETHTDDHMELVHLHTSLKDDWPWAYESKQSLHIDGNVLTIELAITNKSDSNMPCGLGLHPYFPLRDVATLQANCSHVWQMIDHGIPHERVPVPDAWDFSIAKPLVGLGLDHCFAEWDGRAVMHWPAEELTLTMTTGEGSPHLVIYVPKGRDYFCVEPVTNMNDGFNWLDKDVQTGVRILAPGETLTQRTCFEVAATAP